MLTADWLIWERMCFCATTRNVVGALQKSLPWAPSRKNKALNTVSHVTSFEHSHIILINPKNRLVLGAQIAQFFQFFASKDCWTRIVDPSTRSMAPPKGNIPGAWKDTVKEPETSRFSDSDDDKNAGKFSDLSKFMNLPQDLILGSTTLGHLQPRPGFIIYIKDTTETAIRNRVMLVLYVSAESAECLSFCLHWPQREDDHWFVYEAGQAGTTGQKDDSEALEIVLEPIQTPPGVLAPKSGITIDLRQIWNIETISDNMKVAYLGRVKEAPLQKLSRAVKDTFCGYLDSAIRQPEPEPTPQSKPQNPATQANTGSNLQGITDQVSLRCTLYVTMGAAKSQYKIKANSTWYQTRSGNDLQVTTDKVSLHGEVYLSMDGAKKLCYIQAHSPWYQTYAGNNLQSTTDLVSLHGSVIVTVGGAKTEHRIQASSTVFQTYVGNNLQGIADQVFLDGTIYVPVGATKRLFVIQANSPLT